MDQRAGAPVAVGDRIDGKYVVEAVLGIGGMGMVVRATHVDLEEQLALKFLLVESLQRADAVDRFLREARAVRKLRSDHVIRVLDVGRLGGSGLPYIAMELLDGEDLDRALRSRGPLPIDEACAYIIQACEALAEAHARGIIHRDLKPGNLFLARQPSGGPSVKVLDFGIAKTIGPQPSRTRTAAVVGSVYYMSPEQMRSSKHVDARSDIWSMGVTLFELLAGRPPFEGEDVPGVILAVTSDQPPSLGALRSSVPPELEYIVRRCLAKLPDGRPRSMGELAMELVPFARADARAVAERALAHGSVAATSATPAGAEAAPSDSGSVVEAVSARQLTEATWAASRTFSSSKSRVGLAIAGGVFALAAASAIWVGLSRSGSIEKEPPVLASGPATLVMVPPPTAPEVLSPTSPETPPKPASTPSVETAASATKLHASPTAHTGTPGRPATGPKSSPSKKPSALGSGVD